MGNLIDNAMDAVRNNPPVESEKIQIFFTDIGNDFIFEIEDSGREHYGKLMTDDKLFEQGFTCQRRR